MNHDPIPEKLAVPEDLCAAMKAAPTLLLPESREELLALCLGPTEASRFDVCYTVPGRGVYREAEVVRCKNGVAVNFPEDYMRRRDPDCMRIGDALPSDKPRFRDVYGCDFAEVRAETIRWLGRQSLILLPFRAGGPYYGYDALLVCPANAAFFALALVDMQGFRSAAELASGFAPRAVLCVAPPFRLTRFGGRQVVVHRRGGSLHEIFAYNLYPGPSAKKGIFSVLLDIGEREGWIVNHASAALIRTPEGEELGFMHEGASGGGKSELLEALHREENGRIRLGENLLTGERLSLCLRESCTIRPVADDMLLARGDLQNSSGRLVVADAEDGWFLRMDGDRHYGDSPNYERLIIHPLQPLLFLNLDAAPGATCLPWEHTADANGVPCSNPRVILPRRMIGAIPGDRPQEIALRSFGVRMPPSSAEKPDYGVMGLLQLLPASLAWLWRLASPRGFNNPSVTGGGSGLKAEGVGSYWPFCTGRRIPQANLLLRQLLGTTGTLNALIPNQHIGVWQVGFQGEWIAREYLARRGMRLREEDLTPARCPLFGFVPERMALEGQEIPRVLLRPETQPELGDAGYDAGAAILSGFLKEQVAVFLTDELDPLGRRILELCLEDAPAEAYLRLTPPARA